MINNRKQKKELSARVDSFANWYHQIQIQPGLVTPGVHNSQEELAILDRLGLPQDCRNLRVLDIGCCDGFFSFELERRGADVTAIDFAADGVRGFTLAASLLNSKLVLKVANVYDLNPVEFGEFDLVLFLGVFYHLRNPQLALDKIRSVSKPGTLLMVETQLSTSDEVRDSDIPLCQFFPKNTLLNDGTNKWGPNESGLKAMIEESQFSVSKIESYGDRGYAVGTAVVDHTLEEYRRLDSTSNAYKAN